MAKASLMECPTCGKEVSNKANSCPSCGAVLRKPRRGIMGKIIVWVFWGFNILMAVWIYGGGKATVEQGEGLSGAEAVGHAIGTGIGMTALIILWLIGSVILGIMALLTRPK